MTLELVLTRVLSVVLFANVAHLALLVALGGVAVGALCQHLWPRIFPSERLAIRVGWACLYVGVLCVLAMVATVQLPLIEPATEPVYGYSQRASQQLDLINHPALATALLLLSAPFAVGGAIMAALLQRRSASAGTMYAADMIGAAFGAMLFLPLLGRVSAPDAVFAVAALCALGAIMAFREAGSRSAEITAGLFGAAMTLPLLLGQWSEQLPIRYAAGFSESDVTWVRWTPVTRLSLHHNNLGTRVLMDNSSSSEVVLTPERRAVRLKDTHRSLVYRLHHPTSRVAVIGSGAGTDIGVAQGLGFQNIDSIDIVPGIAHALNERFPNNSIIPFQSPALRRHHRDGRTVIQGGAYVWDIIQIVHPTLHGVSGLFGAAWSPALLETTEAFSTFLGGLSQDGTLSFARGHQTIRAARSATAALRIRGITAPERHILLVGGKDSVLLVKPRPFTLEERNLARRWLATHADERIELDPVQPILKHFRHVTAGQAITDDHPFYDSSETLFNGLNLGVDHLLGQVDTPPSPWEFPYHLMAWQLIFVCLLGLPIMAMPLLAWGPNSARQIHNGGSLLGLAACLGFGFMAIEIVLMHQVVHLVGHPTHAITLVLGTLLVASGIGGALSDSRTGPQVRVIGAAIAVVIGLSAVYLLGGIDAAQSTIGTWPRWLRLLVIAGALFPLGMAMGTPLPLALRRVPEHARSLIPWAWALNAWTGISAIAGTVLLSRGLGFRAAAIAGLVAYGLALALSTQLEEVGVEAE
jgi:hypothetical protein